MDSGSSGAAHGDRGGFMPSWLARRIGISPVRGPGAEDPAQDPALIARSLWRKEDFYIFCRSAEQVYTIQVQNSLQENIVLSTLSAAQLAAGTAPR